MAVLTKNEVKSPVLPKETVEVPELGGEVIVHGLMLSARISILSADPEKRLAKMLSATVKTADGVSVYAEREWEEFGAQHFNRALELFDVARRLSGLDAEATTKN